MIEDCDIGLGCTIWHPELSNIYRAQIGAGTQVGPFVEIQAGAVIGEGCHICSHTVIGGGAVIGDNVFIGHGVILSNDRYPRVGYLAQLEPVVVEDGASIGNSVVVLPGVRIGAGAIVGASARVARDVPAWSIVANTPATVIRIFTGKEEMDAYVQSKRDDLHTYA